MSVRINKLLSDAGLGSRREVEKYVVEGRVELNGERAELSDIVVEDDIVTLDGEELPVNDILREVLSMERYLASIQDDEDDFSSPSVRGGRSYSDASSPRGKTLRGEHKVRTMRGSSDDWSEHGAGQQRRKAPHGNREGGRGGKSANRSGAFLHPGKGKSAQHFGNDYTPSYNEKTSSPSWREEGRSKPERNHERSGGYRTHDERAGNRSEHREYGRHDSSRAPRREGGTSRERYSDRHTGDRREHRSEHRSDFRSNKKRY